MTAVHQPPRWAQEMVAEVFADKRWPPRLGWSTNRSAWESSGRAWPWQYRMHVTEGVRAPRWEVQAVLLHECAHILRGHTFDPDTGRTTCPGHDREFWFIAWTLYRRFDLPLRKTLAREQPNFKRARAGYLATRPSRVASTSPGNAERFAALGEALSGDGEIKKSFQRGVDLGRGSLVG